MAARALSSDALPPTAKLTALRLTCDLVRDAWGATITAFVNVKGKDPWNMTFSTGAAYHTRLDDYQEPAMFIAVRNALCCGIALCASRIDGRATTRNMHWQRGISGQDANAGAALMCART